MMKRLLFVFLVSVVALLAAGECHAQFSKLTFGKYGISSIRPESFRAVNGAVWLDVTNPMEGFTVSEVHGVVYKNGVPFVSGRTDDFHVTRGTARCVIRGRAALCEGVSLWTVLGLLSFDPADYSVDLTVRITLDSGATRVVTKKNMPVTALLKLI